MTKPRPFRVDPRVDEDVRSATDYLETQRSGHGGIFRGELIKTLDRVLLYPESWQRFQGDLRRAIIGRFNYAMVYRVVPDAVEIIAVMSCHCDPIRFSLRNQTREP